MSDYLFIRNNTFEIVSVVLMTVQLSDFTFSKKIQPGCYIKVDFNRSMNISLYVFGENSLIKKINNIFELKNGSIIEIFE